MRSSALAVATLASALWATPYSHAAGAADSPPDDLDALSAERAGLAGLTYRSAKTPFSGHAVCSSSAWINGLNLFNPVESYHPNRNGHSLGYAPVVRQALPPL